MNTKNFTASELQVGKTYTVISPFIDFDGKNHGIGETWRLLRTNFVPYEDGLSIFVEVNGNEEQIRLRWRKENQEKLIESFSDYVVEIKKPNQSLHFTANVARLLGKITSRRK